MRAGEGDALAGAIVDGRYRILREIGAGGMGRVYKAQRTGHIKTPVAIKVLDQAWTRHPRVVQRFENEARAISQLVDPHNLRLIDYGRLADERLFIVTEFLEGCTLEELLSTQTPLPVLRTLELAEGIARALAEAHALGIWHRDLKPANIFVQRLTGRETARVLDFGIAKIPDYAVTAPNEVFGTPGYMSPEQWFADGVNQRSDIFAFGAVLYACLTGRPAFGGEGLEIRDATLLKEPAPISSISSDVPPELEELVFKMLAKKPEHRPQQALFVMERLRAIHMSTVKLAGDFDEETAPEADPTHVRPDARASVRIIQGVPDFVHEGSTDGGETDPEVIADDETERGVALPILENVEPEIVDEETTARDQLVRPVSTRRRASTHARRGRVRRPRILRPHNLFPALALVVAAATLVVVMTTRPADDEAVDRSTADVDGASEAARPLVIERAVRESRSAPTRVRPSRTETTKSDVTRRRVAPAPLEKGTSKSARKDRHETTTSSAGPVGVDDRYDRFD